MILKIFNYIKKTYIPQLQVLYGVKTFYNNKCEADDIIGHFAPFLIANNYSKVFKGKSISVQYYL